MFDEEEKALSDAELEEILAVDLKDNSSTGAKEVAAETSEKVVDVLDPDQVKRDVSFSMTNLNEAMMEQAALSVHYARLAAEAKHQMESLKRRIELLEAYLDKHFRENWPADEKMTEKAVQSKIILNKNFQDLNKKLLEAKMNASFAESVQESFRQRRDMLIQIGKDAREELKGQVRITAEGAADPRETLRDLYKPK